MANNRDLEDDLKQKNAEEAFNLYDSLGMKTSTVRRFVRENDLSTEDPNNMRKLAAYALYAIENPDQELMEKVEGQTALKRTGKKISERDEQEIVSRLFTTGANVVGSTTTTTSQIKANVLPYLKERIAEREQSNPKIWETIKGYFDSKRLKDFNIQMNAEEFKKSIEHASFPKEPETPQPSTVKPATAKPATLSPAESRTNKQAEPSTIAPTNRPPEPPSRANRRQLGEPTTPPSGEQQRRQQPSHPGGQPTKETSPPARPQLSSGPSNPHPAIGFSYGVGKEEVEKKKEELKVTTSNKPGSKG